MIRMNTHFLSQEERKLFLLRLVDHDDYVGAKFFSDEPQPLLMQEENKMMLSGIKNKLSPLNTHNHCPLNTQK